MNTAKSMTINKHLASVIHARPQQRHGYYFSRVTMIGAASRKDRIRRWHPVAPPAPRSSIGLVLNGPKSPNNSTKSMKPKSRKTYIKPQGLHWIILGVNNGMGKPRLWSSEMRAFEAAEALFPGRAVHYAK